MVQPSSHAGIEVDYLFAQIDTAKPIVDTSPPCGNMMAGVGPFAIERGMVKATSPETRVMIYNINTRSVIEAIVQTPNGVVEYEGDTAISGVPATAAPVLMNLFDQVGGKTGKLFPTNHEKEHIDGVAVTLMDVGTVMMLIKARDIGLTGAEGRQFFYENAALMQKTETMRREAGLRMGLGDVSGAICIATASQISGTIASELAEVQRTNMQKIVIEHPSGTLAVQLETKGTGKDFTVAKAGVIRTARKIMDGHVFVPEMI